MNYKILVINPGATSTKVAFYEGERCVAKENISHPKEVSFEERKKLVREFMERFGEPDAIAARGGPLKPLKSGTYRVTVEMVNDIKEGRVQAQHVSLLAPLMGWELGQELGIPAFIVDPVSVDEMIPEARLSGFPEIKRKSLSHALNMRAVARKVAEEMGGKFEDFNFVIAHLGGGISVSAFEKGRMIDTTNANEEAPFSPQRAGTVPSVSLVELAFSGKYTKEQLIKKLLKESGLVGYLGTDDMREVTARIEKGDKEAELVAKAMALQIAKYIGEMAVVLRGKIDAIILTGGLANSTWLVERIKEYAGFLGKVVVYPGENELEALALGVLRVLRGEEKEEEY